mgnify:CR=1 FL=1
MFQIYLIFLFKRRNFSENKLGEQEALLIETFYVFFSVRRRRRRRLLEITLA